MKDILIFDDPQKDEFIESFKTPPISPIALEKILGRQGGVYILVNTSPWTDYLYFNKLLYERAHLSAPRRGEPEVLKPPRQKTGPSPAILEGTR